MLGPVRKFISRRDGYARFGRRAWQELERLRSLPAYTSGTSDIVGFDFAYTHPHSLADIYTHVYVDRGYSFRPTGSPPVILDGGANIGVSVVWFKQQFPDARIIAFEPDPQLAEVLRRNVAAGGLTDVTVLEQALWVREEVLTFLLEGSDSGRLGDETRTWRGREWERTEVSAVRLKDWLAEPLDLLKLDIEGAEIDVIADCAGSLSNVSNIILEYHSLKDQPQRLGTTLTVLEEAGFRLSILPEWVPQEPMTGEETNAGFDLQLQVFARRPAPAR